MAKSLRDRRLEQEIRIFQELAAANADRMRVRSIGTDGDAYLVSFRLSGCEFLSLDRRVGDGMDMEIRFTRYYPLVPPEVSFIPAIFHPNVSPESGFVCLFEDYRMEYGVVEYLQIAQQVATWQIWNGDPQQVLSPEAVAWLEAGASGIALPLRAAPLMAPAGTLLGNTNRWRAVPYVDRLTPPA